MQIKINSLSGPPPSGKDAELSLAEEIFACPKRSDILARAVRWQRAKKQAGTHQAKDKSEVRGTNAKPWRQKGTGRARHGSLRSPQFRGGGITFGPTSRPHAHLLPKRVRRLAVKTALSVKVADGELLVLDKLETKIRKTKELAKALDKLGVSASALFVDVEIGDGFKAAAANLPGINYLPQKGLNVYDILRNKKLVLTKQAVSALEERLR